MKRTITEERNHVLSKRWSLYLIMSRISYPGSILSRHEAKAALVFRIHAAICHGVNGIMTPEKYLPLIVSQCDPLGSYLRTNRSGGGKIKRVDKENRQKRLSRRTRRTKQEEERDETRTSPGGQ